MTRARPYDRETALAAAMELFWSKGFHATSLRDLEAALQMKPGSIYAAFSSKEALFRAALERYFTAQRAGLAESLAQEGAPLAALAAHLRETARRAAEDRACMLVKTVLECAGSAAPLGALARDYLDALQEDFAAAFARAQAQGELPEGASVNRLARRYQADVIALKVEGQRGTPAAELVALGEDMAREVEALRRPV
ncbi:TetR family transcriptional regulator [Roseivivax sp.]